MQDKLVNWDMVKFKYEVLGVSKDTLVAEFGVSRAVLDFNAKDWQRLNLVESDDLDLANATSYSDVISRLEKSVELDTKTCSLIKQKFLANKYMELETGILAKALDVMNTIDTYTDPIAKTTALKHLTAILGDLLDKNKFLDVQPKSNDGDVDPADQEWNIKIVNVTRDQEELELANGSEDDKPSEAGANQEKEG